MKLKNAVILIIVFSAIALVSEIGSLVYIDIRFGLNERWLSVIFALVHAGIIASVSGVAIAAERQDVRLQKAFALALLVLNAIMLGYTIYAHFAYPMWEMMTPLKWVTAVIPQVQPLFIMLFALMLILPSRPGRVRAGAWLLMTGGFINCCASVISLFSVLLHSGLSYFFDNASLVIQLLGFLHILYSIALVLLAIAMIRKENAQERHNLKSNDVLYDSEVTGLTDGDLLDFSTPGETKVTGQETAAHRPPSVIDWVADFLAIMIPLFGFGYLIWRGFTTKDRYRRNWAAGSLFLSILGMSFYLLSLAAVFDGYIAFENLFLLFAPAIVVCLIIWGGMALRIRDDHFNNHVETEGIPSPWTWVGRMLICAIPIVGLIMLIDWSLDREDDGTRRNWSRAMLIRMGFMVIYYFFLYGFLAEEMHWF